MNTADVVYADRQKVMKFTDEVTHNGFKPLPREKKSTRCASPKDRCKRRARASR